MVDEVQAHLQKDIALLLLWTCLGAVLATLLFFGFPEWCTDTPLGEISLKGVVCSPFLDYVAIKLVIVMLFCFKLRGGSHNALERWKNISPGMDSLRTLIPRILLQIFQWWAVMIVALATMLWMLSQQIHTKWGFSLPEAMRKGYVDSPPDSMSGIPRWLALFSLNSLVVLVALYVTTTIIILLQVVTHISGCGLSLLTCTYRSDGPAIISLPRDIAVQVLLLPIIYSVLAANNVQRMWENLTSTFTDYEMRAVGNSTTLAEVNREIFESNFAVADMYEAWALFCFARMVFQVIQPELRKKIKADAVEVFEGLLLTDVTVFVGVCAVGAFYLIVLSWFRLRLNIEVCKMDSWSAVCALNPYLSGANLLVSSITIYNLFMFEEKFHKFHSMQEFGPRLKFWSIKLMVLVAFWTGILMGVLRKVLHLSPDEGMLFDAAMRIYVMALVSLLNIVAWWPWRPWYSKVQKSLHQLKHAVKNDRGNKYSALLGHNNPVPHGTLALVRHIFPLLDEAAASEWHRVEKYIRSIDDHLLADALERGLMHHTTAEAWNPGRRASMRHKKDVLSSYLRELYPPELA